MRLETMRPRDPGQPHRAATPLELFFDLAYVVAIAQAGAGLHHAEADGHFFAGIDAYLMVFFAIWWAWMNFTWFATAFDTDDWLYRLTTMVQIGGSLTIRALLHAGHRRSSDPAGDRPEQVAAPNARARARPPARLIPAIVKARARSLLP